MASCITSTWGSSTSPRVRLTVTGGTSTNTTIDADWKLEYVAIYPAHTTGSGRSYTIVIDGKTVKTGTYDINLVTGTKTIASGSTTINKGTSVRNITFSVSFTFNITWNNVHKGTVTASGTTPIPAKTSYTISYNANGGTGAPSSQTKWYGTNLILSSTKPSRTGYSFLGWSTSSTATSATWAAGGTYSTNASDVLYAVWKANTYTVKYNANGGTGAPGNQTKTYGINLMLSSTKPTRTNYDFKGWGTSASATTVAYAAGASYTKNAAITLYAIWQLAYTAPRITNFTVGRCTSSGASDENGTYAQVSFSWATDKTISSIKIEWKDSSSVSYESSTTITATGTSGTVNAVIGDDALSVEYTYNIRVTVTDSNGSSNSTKNVSAMFFTMDFLNGGKGVSFGKPADKANFVDFAMNVLIRNGYSLSKEHSDGSTSGMLTSKKITDGGGGGANYFGIFKPDEDDAGWIRTPKSGLLPWQSGGYSSIGSNTWKFTNGYFVNGYFTKVDATNGYFDNLYIGNRNIKTNNVLWSGGLYMTAGHTATLSDAITNQIHGIAIVFSRYSGSTVRDYQFQTFYVPKERVKKHPGGGQTFLLTSDGSFSVMASKYLYLNDTSIVGNDINTKTGTGNSGVKYENNGYVMRYVIGV